MHQSFATTAALSTGMGGDYDFSAFSALLYAPLPRDKLEVKTLLFALPFAWKLKGNTVCVGGGGGGLLTNDSTSAY